MLLRSTQNAQASPVVVNMDFGSNFFAYTTRFKTQVSYNFPYRASNFVSWNFVKHKQAPVTAELYGTRYHGLGENYLCRVVHVGPITQSVHHNIGPSRPSPRCYAPFGKFCSFVMPLIAFFSPEVIFNGEIRSRPTNVYMFSNRNMYKCIPRKSSLNSE